MLWRARPRVVGDALATQALPLLAVPALPLFFALAERVWALAAALAVPACAFAALAALGRRRALPRDLRPIEGVALLVTLFALAIVSAVAPLIVLGLAPLDAAFEAVSAVTSTGLTVAEGTMDWPVAGHVLRGWLQWCGGFAIAVAGVAILAGPHPVAHVVSEAGLNEPDLLTSTREHARALLRVYVAITGLAIVALALLLPTWWEGLAVALAAVSTGGFTPRPDSLASYDRAAQIVTLVVCIATAISLLFYVRLAHRDLPEALRTNAVPVTLGVLAGGALAAVLAGDGSDARLDAALNFVSGMTTAGFSVAPISPDPSVLVLVIAGMIVGGGIGSTAGGIKIDRGLALLAAIRVSLDRMRAPDRAVIGLTSRGRPLGEAALSKVVAIAVCYLLSLALGWLALTTLGLPPVEALFETTSALSTVGLSTGLVGPDLPAAAKLVLMASMLLGRLEFLGLILVIAPRTWRGAGP
ncbi:MAG: TrkH family potassium uptake protein [Shimia sp.]